MLTNYEATALRRLNQYMILSNKDNDINMKNKTNIFRNSRRGKKRGKKKILSQKVRIYLSHSLLVQQEDNRLLQNNDNHLELLTKILKCSEI